MDFPWAVGNVCAKSGKTLFQGIFLNRMYEMHTGPSRVFVIGKVLREVFLWFDINLLKRQSNLAFYNSLSG